MQLTENDILYEDNHLLVVDKPAGIATMGAEGETETVAKLAAAYLKRKYNKPGNVFIGVVSRLDKPVSGVLVLARTSKAASRLSDQIRRQVTRKRYVAWVSGEVKGSEWIELTNYVRKNDAKQRMECFDSEASGHQSGKMQLAELRALPLVSDGRTSLLRVELLTGRKHQIRIQLAHYGTPILGDRKYGVDAGAPNWKSRTGIALHASELEIEHPTRKEKMVFRSSPLSLWAGLPPKFREALS
ncbi:MAG: RluA family pseudouridine synthase [Pirellulaceae bacterium]